MVLIHTLTSVINWEWNIVNTIIMRLVGDRNYKKWESNINTAGLRSVE